MVPSTERASFPVPRPERVTQILEVTEDATGAAMTALRVRLASLTVPVR